jgi:hypothetical protein
VTFTEEDLAEHDRAHVDKEDGAPRLGCPVCFLVLVYAQIDPPMVDVAEAALKERLTEKGMVGAGARAMMQAFLTIPERINERHLVRKGMDS